MDKQSRMKELAGILKAASKAYYQDNTEIMSNFEYDKLYDELVALEKETGIVLAGSPTMEVGYEAQDELTKVEHERPMLSLDKTKERDVLKAFIGKQPSMLSWKLDGLTIVLTYRDGVLAQAVTRGNGIVGEDITNNARVFNNLPLKIAYTGELVLRGEALITYADFERINSEIPDVDARYKNPRNLCSGSVRQLNNKITAERNVHFFAFSLVRADGVDFENSHARQMQWLKEQGFETVEYTLVTADTLDAAMDDFAARVQTNPFPSDGLVVLYDDIAYGESLGSTAKFPRNSMAFKWADEIRETTLLEIEWSPSRTGLINPVAIFEPVELEGTTVSRASVHNISIMKQLELGIGDTIEVYKANMIIPQIAENKTRSGVKNIPQHCPACDHGTVIQKTNDVESLYCPNPVCPAKAIKSFALFVSRDALNIDGMSEATLEKFIGRGFLHDFSELFALSIHRDDIVAMDGFGQKSYDRLMESIEKARHTTLPKLLYALGIPNIGLANAKLICKHFDYEPEKVRHASVDEISEIEGLGEVIAAGYCAWFAKPENQTEFDRLLAEVELEKPQAAGEQPLAGKVFVITGSLEHFTNRSELKEQIEMLGGKVTGSVTKKTSYLINNDLTSNSSKNKKAKELGVEIISEGMFLSMVQEGKTEE